MARIELNIVALGDFKSVDTQIKALRAQVELLNKSLTGAGLSTNLTKQLNEANSAFKASMLSTGQFTETTVKLKTETEKFGHALVAGKLKLNEYFSIIRGQSSAAAASMRALAIEQTKLQNSIVTADPTKKGVFSVYTPTSIDQIANKTKIATNYQNLFNIAVDKGSQSLINWGKNTQWAGRQLTVGLTVPMAMFGASAMKTFQQVNDELVKLQKVYGTGVTQPTQKALDDIKKQVVALSRELAGSMGVAASDTAAMAAGLAATGKTGNDLISATRESMRLAKLGELDQQSAMQATVSLQNVYKLSTQDLTKSIDFLNAVENQTSTSLQDLVDGIPRVGPIVQQLGGSFKDTAVMMVAMKEAGVPAAQSANAIKSALASLINPSKNASEAFAAYNINLKGISSKTGGNPVQMFIELQKSMQGLDSLAKAQLIEKLFGKYQQARIQALITNLGAVNSQTKTAFELVNASAPQLAALAASEMKVATESTTGKFRRAVETIKADIIPLGEKIMEVATVLLKFGDSIAKAFGSLPAPVKGVLGVLAGAATLVGPIIMLVGLMGNFAGYILKTVFNLKNLITGTKTFGELFTPEMIASQNAAELFGNKILKDVNAIDLLNQSVAQLIGNLNSMNMSMGAGTGTGVVPAIAGTNGKQTINKVRANNPLAAMQALGLINPGGGTAFESGSGGTILPSFTMSTPSGSGTGSFNTQLTSGSASGSEWTKWAKESGRGYESHTGLMALMRASGIDESKAKAVGEKVHLEFTKQIQGYAGNLSDSIMSKEAFSAYDRVIAEEFASNPDFLDAYAREKTMVGGVRTEPTRRSNGKFAGGSLRNIFSPGRRIPFFANLRGEGRAESHIFPPEFVEKMQSEQAMAAGIAVEQTTQQAYKGKVKIKPEIQPLTAAQQEQASEILSNDIVATQEKAEKKASRKRGLKLGAGMALVMGGQMLSSAMPQGSVASSLTGSASMGAGLGMMFGPEGAAIGAALGLAYGGITALIKAEKDHAESARATFKVSGDAIDMFGGKITDQSIKIHGFAKDITKGIKEITEAQSDAEKIKALDSKTSDLKKVSDSIAGYSTASSVIGTVKQFAAAQVANGMDPAGVERMVTAMLTYAGKTQYLSEALKSITRDTKDVATATETWLKKAKQQSSYISDTTRSYSSLNNSQKIYADASLKVVNTILNMNTSWSDAIKTAKILQDQLGNTTEAFNMLKLAAEAANDVELSKLISKLEKAGMSLQNTLLLARMLQVTPLLEGQSYSDYIKTEGKKYLESERQAAISRNAAKMAEYNKAVAAAKKQALADSKSALEVAKNDLKIAEDKVKAEQKQTDELKKQQDYMASKTDIENKIRQAVATGNYLEANQLRQQLANTTNQYNSETTQTPAQKEAARLQALVEKLQAEKDAKDKAKGIVSSVIKPTLETPMSTKEITSTIGLLITALKENTAAVNGQKPGGQTIGPDTKTVGSKTLDAAAKQAGVGKQTRTYIPEGKSVDEAYWLFNWGKKTYAVDKLTGTNVYEFDVETNKLGPRIKDPKKVKAKAQAGFVSPGRYLVGEQGPEILDIPSYGNMIGASGTSNILSRMSFASPSGSAKLGSSYSNMGAAGATVVNNYELGGIHIANVDSSVDIENAINDAFRKIATTQKMSGTITKVGGR